LAQKQQLMKEDHNERRSYC